VWRSNARSSSSRLVLLDEPFTGLDDASAGALVARLRAITRQRGHIVCLATRTSLDLADGLSTARCSLMGMMDRMRTVGPSPRRFRRATYRAVMAAPEPRDVFAGRVAGAAEGPDGRSAESRNRVHHAVLRHFVCAVLAFALVKEGRRRKTAQRGFLWNRGSPLRDPCARRTFDRERQSETLRALLMARRRPAAIYVGKLLGHHRPPQRRRTRAGTAAVAFSVPGALLSHPFWLSAVLVSGTVGFSAVGTLFRRCWCGRAAATSSCRAVVSDHGSGHHCRRPRDRGAARADVELSLVRFWVALLLALDVVFVTLALWTFEPLMTD